MEKKNKGLADNQEGEFILNESGTSVTTDRVEERTTGADTPPVADANITNTPEENGPALKPGNNAE